MKYDSQQQSPVELRQECDCRAMPRAASGWNLSSMRVRGDLSIECPHEAEVLHELVEKQATLRPDAVAIRDEQAGWTYGEVDQRANQIARLLRSHGARTGTMVGVLLPRSADAIIAILGVLKAGAAYVPMDVESPREWLLTIAVDSEIELVVTHRECSSQLPNGAVKAIYLDSIGESLADAGGERFNSGVLPADKAYVIYTSGSTGEPQGVVVEHRNIVYSTRCRLDYYATRVVRIALVPSLAFDASVATIFWALSQGGTLCIPPPGLERDPTRLSHWISSERITHWLSVPALYQLLLEQSAERLYSLRVVVLGGESCPASLVQSHHSAVPQAELYNEYGPTEASVWSCVHPCRAVQPNEVVPIGRPLPGTRLLVLDENGRPVATGEPGELYIGGPGVARGYLRDKRLTSQRFVTHQLPDHSSDRLYRTGDRAVQRADGAYVFLGRQDSQAKVRGHRVELGQIESVIGQIEGVVQAAVVTRKCRKHEQIVAFVVSRDGSRLSVGEIRQRLKLRLPNYMIPTQIAFRDRLPLTARGKIDRQSLRSVEAYAPARDRSTVPPADETERRLVACWEVVFGREGIGVTDDFFDLGGDSLLAAGLFARIEATFGRTLSPETLLEAPTVRLLARALRSARATSIPSAAVRIHAGLHQPPLFCLPGIGGHVLEFRELARQLRARHAVYGLRPAGLDDGREPHTSIEAMAAYAVNHMRCVQPLGPYALVGYSLGGVVAFEMARQLKQAGQEIALLALLDSRLWLADRPFSLRQRLRLHMHNLLHSTWRGRWRYLCERGRLLSARLRRLSLRQSDGDVILGLGLSAESRRVAYHHWQAWRDYRPGDFDGELSLFVARQHPAMLDEQRRDPTLGWGQRTIGGVDITLMNAPHAELLRPESAKVLAIAIDSRLTRAAERHSSYPEGSCHKRTH